jgi:hypothetical protein
VGIYAYCVVPAEHRPPGDLVGVAGAPVAYAEAAGLGVWVSVSDRPQVAVEAVQAHNHVVEVAVTETVTPVPLRFGQWLESAAALSAAIGERSGDYRAKLERFAGCLEFGLRILDPAAGEAREVQAADVTSGREYMAALRENTRLADQQRAVSDQVQSRVHDLLQDIVRDEHVDTAHTKHAVLAVTHLVAREHFDEYRGRARDLRTIFPALRLLLSGPWPPYSFAV